MSGVEPRPLCGLGRCGQLLAALAEREAGFPEREGGKIADVICAVLEEFGVNTADTAVRAATARHIRLVAGLPSPGGLGR